MEKVDLNVTNWVERKIMNFKDKEVIVKVTSKKTILNIGYHDIHVNLKR
jgi:hypothetical protein